MVGEYNNVKIMGVATAVPEKMNNNELYERILGGRRVRKQAMLTGIMKTHVSPVEQRTSDLCYAAAMELLQHLKWKPEEVSVLIFVSQTTNYKMPSTAFFLQKRLGIGEDCLVYDINMGCSAFNVGSQAVISHLSNMPVGTKGILLCGDICCEVNQEHSLEPETLKNNMLFGSAGAAIAFENVSDSIVKYLLKSNGKKYDSIIRHEGRPTEMEGNAVFDFAINEVSEDIIRFQENILSDQDKVDYYVLHQAQKLIVDSIIDTCSLDEDKVLNSYADYGNTSGASIPLSICANRDKFSTRKNVNILMSGFGVGLSWTILYASIPVDNILPIIYTDEHYDEDKRATHDLWNKNIIFLGASDIACYNVLRNMNSTQIGLQTAINVGFNKEELVELEKETVYTNVCVVEPNLDNVIEKLVELPYLYNGIVIAISQFSEEDVMKVVNTLIDKEKLVGKYPSVVLLDGHYEETIVKENILNKIIANISNKSIKINMIMFNQSQMKFNKKLNRDSEWIQEYVDSGFDEGFIKPLDIAYVLQRMLSDKVNFLNGSVLKIDNRVE